MDTGADIDLRWWITWSLLTLWHCDSTHWRVLPLEWSRHVTRLTLTQVRNDCGDRVMVRRVKNELFERVTRQTPLRLN